MSKHVCKILPLLLCLLLMACLLPAAYADGVEVSTLAELQNAITAFNQQREQDPTARIDTYTSGDFTITGNITIPDGFQLRCGNDLTIAAEATVTVNGKLDAIDNGYINILGKVVNYGQVRMFGSGVIHVGGTLENRSQICYENVTSDVKHLVVDKKENLQIWGPFCVYDGVSLTEDVLGFPVDNWCRSIKKDEPNVSAFIPLFGIQLEDKSSSGSYSYIEVRGTEAFTLTKDMTVPAGTKVVMNSIVLTVPDGNTLTVNGELIVMALVNDGGNVVIGDGGSISYPDRVEVTTLAQLKAALDANTSRIIVVQDIALDADLTIPESCYVKVRHDSTLTVPAGKTLTINGKLEASFNGRIDVLGTLQNNGEIEMFDGGVVDVKGTYAHADGRPITFNRDGRQDAAMPKFIVEQGAVYTLNIFRTDEGLVAADVLEGINPNTYSCHSNYDRDKHVIREMRIYYPSSRAGIEDMANRALGYIEINGLDTYTLSTDVEIPVFDDTTDTPTPATVDMRETKLVVPSGRTLTVNGELAVKELVIESGGSVTVNGFLRTKALEIQEGGSVTVNGPGYMDIGGGGFNILNDGTLTLNNTWIDGPYPKSNPGTLNNIVYEGDDAGIILHLEVGNPDGVASALADASAASSKHVHCYVQLLTDWTMTGTINVPNILLEIPGKYTVNIDGELTIGEIQNWGTINLNEKGRLSPSDMSLNGVINVVGKDARLNEVKLHDLVNGRPRGSVTVADASARVFFRGGGLDEALLPEWITLQGSGTEACICYRADNEQDFVGMTSKISSLPDGFVGSLRVQYPATIQGNVDFPGVELRIEGKKGGSLTIAEGATLTARNVNLHSAVMTVSGTFIAGPSYRHSGSVTMNSDDGNNSTLIVTDTGILGGNQCTVEVPKGIETASCVFGFNPGQMKDVSHQFRPNFQIYLIVAEMSLPAGLTTIESEAFAGGSFNSVYIPESVTSIASDAFGDRTGLKVYGEYGTAAETFAHEHGFPFAPPNLATQPA